jgi:hypothetical protein
MNGDPTRCVAFGSNANGQLSYLKPITHASAQQSYLKPITSANDTDSPSLSTDAPFAHLHGLIAVRSLVLVVQLVCVALCCGLVVAHVPDLHLLVLSGCHLWLELHHAAHNVRHRVGIW